MRNSSLKSQKIRLVRIVYVAVVAVIGCLVVARAKHLSTVSRLRVDSPVVSRIEEHHDVAAAPSVYSGHEDIAKVFPPSELPMVTTEEGARTSLRYLAENGADLSRPMPSKHRIFAANAPTAAQLADWGRAHGFEVRGPVMVRSHIGEPQQSLELVRTEVPDPARIEREGRLILAAVQQTPGAFYQTWCGEIVR